MHGISLNTQDYPLRSQLPAVCDMTWLIKKCLTRIQMLLLLNYNLVNSEKCLVMM
jgi:hypothetical protein